MVFICKADDALPSPVADQFLTLSRQSIGRRPNQRDGRAPADGHSSDNRDNPMKKVFVMNSDNRNLLLAIALSMLFCLSTRSCRWPRDGQQSTSACRATGRNAGRRLNAAGAGSSAGLAMSTTTETTQVTADTACRYYRCCTWRQPVAAGGRLDDLRLLQYGEENADDPERVHLLRRTGGQLTAILPKSCFLTLTASA